jgi:hypothetical protein
MACQILRHCNDRKPFLFEMLDPVGNSSQHGPSFLHAIKWMQNWRIFPRSEMWVNTDSNSRAMSQQVKIFSYSRFALLAECSHFSGHLHCLISAKWWALHAPHWADNHNFWMAEMFWQMRRWNQQAKMSNMRMNDRYPCSLCLHPGQNRAKLNLIVWKNIDTLIRWFKLTKISKESSFPSHLGNFWPSQIFHY